MVKGETAQLFSLFLGEGMDIKDHSNLLGGRVGFIISWLVSTRPSLNALFFDLRKVDHKADTSEVTEGDRSIEREFRQKIQSTFPEDGVIGEEYPAENRQGDYTWTIDPIDGTRAFIQGIPFYGTIIGLYRGEEALFGVIHYPTLHELIYAVTGHGCFWQSTLHNRIQKCEASKTAKLEDAVVNLSGYEFFKNHGLESIFSKACEISKTARCIGGDCYSYSLLCRGKFDLVIEPGLSLWETVALQVLVRESGAEIIEIDGTEKKFGFKSAVIGNAQILEQAKQRLLC